MADMRRLGKRGSYRLGKLATPLPMRSKPSRRFEPSFTHSSRQGSPLWWLLGWPAGVVVIVAGAAFGWWFVPFIVGLAGGVVSVMGGWRLRSALLAVTTAAAVGWAIPLCWDAWHGAAVGAAARVVAALAGLPPHAPVAIAVTLLVAILQALAGLWLGRVVVPRDEEL